MRDPRPAIPPDSAALTKARTIFRLSLTVAAGLVWLALRPLWHDPATQSFLQFWREHALLSALGLFAYLELLIPEHEMAGEERRTWHPWQSGRDLDGTGVRESP